MALTGEAALDRLNDRLLGILHAADVAAVREPDFIRLGDILLAVTATWDNPDRPPPDRPQTFGVELAINAPSLLDEVAHEYSYGVGATEAEAAAAALERFVALDLPVLREAAAGEMRECVELAMTGNAANGASPGAWQVYLGPLQYMAEGEGVQPCCQSCLFVMSMPFLADAVRTPRSCAIKIVASRDADGSGSADCRRNGHDMPEAITQIAEAAARTWEPRGGTQTRRQYLYFRAPASSETPS